MPLTARQEKFLIRVIATLEEHEIEVPEPIDLAHQLSVPPQAVTAILNLGVDRGDLKVVAPKLFYTTKQLDHLQEKVREIFKQDSFDIATFRKSLDISRKYADPLFHYFEEENWFDRIGSQVRLK